MDVFELTEHVNANKDNLILRIFCEKAMMFFVFSVIHGAREAAVCDGDHTCAARRLPVFPALLSATPGRAVSTPGIPY